MSLSETCKLKVNVVFYDEETNVLQEFKASPEMDAQWIVDFKSQKKRLIQNGVQGPPGQGQQKKSRKSMPRKNWIEEADLTEVLKDYKQYQPSSQGMSKRQISSRRMLNKLLEKQKAKQIEMQGLKQSARISFDASGAANQNDGYKNQQQLRSQSGSIGSENDPNASNDDHGPECSDVPKSAKEPCIVKSDIAGNIEKGQRRKLVVQIKF